MRDSNYNAQDSAFIRRTETTDEGRGFQSRQINTEYYLHYNLNTEKAYLPWVRFFRWHGRNGVMQHPRDMGAAEVEAFLSVLANERKVSASTHNQALSAILFLYREVLGIDLPWLNGVNRPAQKRRILSVLTKEERAPTFALYKSCWATAMCPPP